ncbi:tripartite tricarboxylate transporter TctB family protein [Sinorhizobium medicae]|uniref:tripartite tricarboxylate transporter TctB family protein n=1 Tax=Sinorhizobium medicae TaxID=110321 RepID=UPI000FD80751|nr:tripartite tricarboxylate transporter TctB family protein [Sinorhizobium medicae]RVO73538.1 tripartite tricarboxylate transporter TctB family protein [Sinorhizobium medicae]
MQLDVKDIGAGLFFMGVGLLYGTIAWFGLPIGSALDMGPGYFPLILSSMLFVLGIAIAGRGLKSRPAERFGKLPWRGIVLLSGATVIFAAFIDDFGMVPGIFLTSLVAAMADSEISMRKAALIALGVAGLCTATFSIALRLPIPIIGPGLIL